MLSVTDLREKIALFSFIAHAIEFDETMVLICCQTYLFFTCESFFSLQLQLLQCTQMHNTNSPSYTLLMKINTINSFQHRITNLL